ncbi:uncharacterized mitochondrial protein-like protein, partial [Tanacetum coccineum]
SSNHETNSENSFSVFDGRSSDEESTLANDKSSKENGYKAVPPPITANFLTLKADISFAGLDEYAIWNKIIESQTTELNTKTSETVGKTNDANTEKPKSVSELVVSNPQINRDSVIIEDWNSGYKEEGYEMKIVRPETQTVKKSGQTSKKQGMGYKKVKACFICKSTDHLIKDYNFHDKKSQEPKLKMWLILVKGKANQTGFVSTARPSISTARTICTARPSISTTRTIFTARPSISTARPSISTARPVCTARPSIGTVRPSIKTTRPVCIARPSISTAKLVYASRPIYPRMDNVRPRGSCSSIKRSYYTKPAFRPKDLKQDVKTCGVKNMTTDGKRAVVNTGKGKLDTDLKRSRWFWRPKGNYLDHVSKDSGSFMLKKGNPEILLQDHAVVDSGCSSHMTGNKAYLSDYEDFNGGFVAFGSDPKGGKITDSEDVIDKEGDHQMPEDEQVLHDELEKMVTQELAAKAMDDVSRQDFEKKGELHLKRRQLKLQVLTNLVLIGNLSNTPYVSAASTPTGANAGDSSFVYLGGKIPIDASTLPNTDLPIDPNMPDLEDASDTLLNDGIFNGAYDDKDVGVVADFNNMDNTIAVKEPKTISQALQDKSWVEAMQEELLQFKLQKVWVLVDLPYRKKVIGKKWVFRDKRDERSIVVKKTKARYIAQGLARGRYSYDDVFGTVAILRPNRRFMCIEFEECMHKRFQMSSMGELTFFLGLQVKQQPDGIFISQDKYVADILKKFDFLSIRTATTPIESNKPLVKDEDGVDVDVHVYRSMIGSQMYLTASRLDIMFVVCACARFQVTPKASHLNAVKRIFRYLKHQPKLGLWYPRDSPFELEAYSDSDYGGASLDRKSTTGGCQFLGRRLISWQCKKQTIVANSTTKAEYVAADNCCGQNPAAHSRTKHIEIRFHFTRDCYEKRLIEHWIIESVATIEESSLVSRESLERDRDGTEEFLLSSLFDFRLTKVSTDRLKVSTDRQS